MRNYANRFSLKKMAKLMRVSCSGYYDDLKRGCSKRKKENIKLIKEIRSVYEENRGIYGSPRIHAVLKQRHRNKNSI